MILNIKRGSQLFIPKQIVLIPDISNIKQFLVIDVTRNKIHSVTMRASKVFEFKKNITHCYLKYLVKRKTLYLDQAENILGLLFIKFDGTI